MKILWKPISLDFALRTTRFPNINFLEPFDKTNDPMKQSVKPDAVMGTSNKINRLNLFHLKYRNNFGLKEEPRKSIFLDLLHI